MFEEYSSAYYVGELNLREYNGTNAVMQSSQHEQLQSQMQKHTETHVRLPIPIVIKLGTTHLVVKPEHAVPSDSIALPREIASNAGISELPVKENVFLLKPERAQQILQAQASAPNVSDGRWE